MTKSDTLEESNMASYDEAFKRGPISEKSDSLSSVKPVVVEESDVFSYFHKEATRSLFITISEMYKAVGAVVPDRSVMGLQRIKGLWRIYLDTLKDQECLLSEGLEIRGKSISIYSINPRVRIQENSTDVKIRIKDVPLSADDGHILRALEGYNCVIMKHLRERLRYKGMISNCQTGERIVYCEDPLISAIPSLFQLENIEQRLFTKVNIMITLNATSVWNLDTKPKILKMIGSVESVVNQATGKMNAPVTCLLSRIKKVLRAHIMKITTSRATLIYNNKKTIMKIEMLCNQLRM
ncbi:unnamed protein product [Mytilus coruscus]|uniref:Uncharacterized protein n=1 Tax=Mytilus coruscus TaxID=42192 RepID=A0A6J8A0F0_MYTCO|nr:unnamed protein product [Mytilus coruscus]